VVALEEEDILQLTLDQLMLLMQLTLLQFPDGSFPSCSDTLNATILSKCHQLRTSKQLLFLLQKLSF
jgi:hypothetical protein